MKHVYVIGPLEGCYKIGRARSVGARLRSLGVLPVELEAVAVIPTANAAWLERYLQAAFAARHVRGEWFRLTQNDLAMIAEIAHADGVEDLPAALVRLHGTAPPLNYRPDSATDRAHTDDDLVAIKVPQWMKRVAAQIGVATGETIGQVIVRLAADALRQDHADKVFFAQAAEATS
jgi:hypothetical protein